jgi:hypothetical protein
MYQEFQLVKWRCLVNTNIEIESLEQTSPPIQVNGTDTNLHAPSTHLNSSFHGVPQVTHHHPGLILYLVGAGQSRQSLEKGTNKYVFSKLLLLFPSIITSRLYCH